MMSAHADEGSACRIRMTSSIPFSLLPIPLVTNLCQLYLLHFKLEWRELQPDSLTLHILLTLTAALWIVTLCVPRSARYSEVYLIGQNQVLMCRLRQSDMISLEDRTNLVFGRSPNEIYLKTHKKL